MAREIDLLLGPDDLPRLTSISGNVDIDKLTPFIYMAQTTHIKKMLGTELYDKILTDYTNDALAGDYLIIYEDFIVDILTYRTSFLYWNFGNYQMDNAGAYVKTPENAEPLEDETLVRVAKQYEQLSQAVELVYDEWIKDKNLPELQSKCTVNKSRGLNWRI